jgi:hypothetical protein
MSAIVPFRESKSGQLIAPGRRVTSLDMSTAEGQRLAYIAQTSRDFTLSELAGQVILIRDIHVHWVQDESDTPDPSGLRIRIALLSPDGSVITTSSMLTLACLLTYSEVTCRLPPWEPPAQFRVHLRAVPGKPGHRYLWLEWVPSEAEQGS